MPEEPDPEDDVDEETRMLLHADFEIGQALRERMIPRALLYYTGENEEEEDYDEHDEDEDEEESDEDSD